MRIAVISDIHGNCVALDAVISDVAAHPVDRWICLGDPVQGGAQPKEVVERLRELDCTTILGNTDAFVLSTDAGHEETDDQLVVRDWTVAELGNDLEYLRTFVPTYEADLQEAGTLLCFHGTPSSYDEVLLPETPSDQLAAALAGHAASVLCGGHTHLQWTTVFEHKQFFNPGSVGLAYNRHQPAKNFRFSSWADYAVLSVDGTSVRLEFCTVPFDVDELLNAYRTKSHPAAERIDARYR